MDPDADLASVASAHLKKLDAGGLVQGAAEFGRIVTVTQAGQVALLDWAGVDLATLRSAA